MRNITIDNVTWKYKVGKSFLVALHPDTKQKLLITLARLLGYDNMEYERAKWKRYFDIQVTPKLVADFIKHNDWYLRADLIEIKKHRDEHHRTPVSPPANSQHCDCCGEWLI